MPENADVSPPTARYGWLCITDHTVEQGHPGHRAGTRGPSDIDGELLSRLAGGEGSLWRTLDGDDNPVHEGRYLELPDAPAKAVMAPLDELSGPDEGATTIQVRPNMTQTWKEV